MKLALPHALSSLQDRLLQLLGSAVEGRAPLVAAMLRRDAKEATAYWLQLVVAIGIATLGLVVGSTAVVIGAMLVAPLMGPIVGLAMGLATGSPFLVLRSAGRIVLSVAAAVSGAAIITVSLPFHELNAEIAARTSPTVLDLITAAFCALAGVYASLRPGSDTTATAAGTSIGISLVPPLCASGYGLGTSTWSVAGGAALLFLTNLVAIVVVGTVAFLASGFNRVDVSVLEREELGREGMGAPVARALAQWLSRLFDSRGGPALRFLMPLALLGALFVPLRRALDEVAWEVRVRAAVSDALAHEPVRIVQSRARVERHTVEIVAVILGKASDAEGTRARLDARVRGASNIVPRIEIFAVPDSTAFAGLESTMLAARVAPKPSPPPPSLAEQLDGGHRRIREAVLAFWPAAAAGEPIAIEVGSAGDGPLPVRVVHLGAALGPDALETVERAVNERLGQAVRVVGVAVPTSELSRKDGDLPFVASVVAGIHATSTVPGMATCVARPEISKGRAPTQADSDLAHAIEAALAGHPGVAVTTGPWSVRFTRERCTATAAPASSAAR